MNYHKIEKFSIANGDGIRVVLWVSGCSLQCRDCHNPETWDFFSGKPFDVEARQELFEALNKPYIKGITFSGGNPLEKENFPELFSLCVEIKKRFPNKDIWLYTGFKFEDFKNSIIMEYIDVLVDGQFIPEFKDISLKYCGSTNQRVIDVKNSLRTNKIALWQD